MNTSPASPPSVPNPYYSPTPAQLRRVVLSYLCHNCYVDTARAFARDSQRIALDDLSNGLEFGFGQRAAIRDLVPATLPNQILDPPSDIPTPLATERPLERLRSTALLKDNDGDEEMAPAPLPLSDESRPDPSLLDETPIQPAMEASPAISEAIEVDFDTSGGSIWEQRVVEQIIKPDTDMDVIEAAHDDAAMNDQVEMDPQTDTELREELLHGEFDEELLQEVRLRKEIREHIYWGRINKATDLLEKHFPTVLHEPPSTAARQTSPIPRSQPGSPISHSSPSSPPPPPENLYPLSLSPAHLALNLRIQAFIEAVRTRPIFPPSSAASISPDQFYGHAFPLPHHEQLELGRHLYRFAHALPNAADRAVYLKELDMVWALMAYKEPETSPPGVVKYLDWNRREATAGMVNSAILLRTGHTPMSTLEQYVRYTGAIWDHLNESGVRISNDAKLLPLGAKVPPGRGPSLKFPNSARDGLAPSFDFKRFLSAVDK